MAVYLLFLARFRTPLHAIVFSFEFIKSKKRLIGVGIFIYIIFAIIANHNIGINKYNISGISFNEDVVRAVMAATIVLIFIIPKSKKAWLFFLTATFSALFYYYLIVYFANRVIPYHVSEKDAAVLVLVLILPFLNALVDWLSWGTSRLFLSRAACGPGGVLGAVRLSIELLLALLIGVGFLVFLAVILANGIEFFNYLQSLQNLPQLKWLSQVEEAEGEPWNKGLMVMGLLLTTLMPTFLHIVAGLAGIFLAWTPDARRLVAEIPYKPGDETQPSLAEIRKDEIFWTLYRGRFWLVVAVPLTFLLMAILFEAFSVFVYPYGHFLAAVARCSTAWSHGQCEWW